MVWGVRDGSDCECLGWVEVSGVINYQPLYVDRCFSRWFLIWRDSMAINSLINCYFDGGNHYW